MSSGNSTGTELAATLGTYCPLAALSRLRMSTSFSRGAGFRPSILPIAVSAAGHSTTLDTRRGRVISGAACAAPASTRNRPAMAPDLTSDPFGNMPDHMPIEWRINFDRITNDSAAGPALPSDGWPPRQDSNL